jgi:hypothetical protein
MTQASSHTELLRKVRGKQGCGGVEGDLASAAGAPEEFSTLGSHRA